MISAIPRGYALARLGGVAPAMAFVLVLFWSSSTPAAFCGDDVGGLRMACACGDDVVSDTVLSSSDPVVAERCPGDGLVVFVPADSDGITLNLDGHSLVGSGRGVGIRVVRGGRLGSVIVGGSEGDPLPEIANFRAGIAASGRNALRELRSVWVHHNAGEGVRIHSSDARIEDVETSDNGRDGASLFGHGLTVSGFVAEGNRSDGLQVRGAGSTVDATVRANRRHGMILAGRGNTVEKLLSDDNDGAGLSTTGTRHEIRELRGEGNALGILDDGGIATIGVAK